MCECSGVYIEAEALYACSAYVVVVQHEASSHEAGCVCSASLAHLILRVLSEWQWADSQDVLVGWPLAGMWNARDVACVTAGCSLHQVTSGILSMSLPFYSYNLFLTSYHRLLLTSII